MDYRAKEDSFIPALPPARGRPGCTLFYKTLYKGAHGRTQNGEEIGIGGKMEAGWNSKQARELGLLFVMEEDSSILNHAQSSK